jgi:ribose transport system ATP-binding protein
LLLDEPTSAYLIPNASACLDHRRLRQRGVGIIYISHHLAEVPMVGQRVTVLRDGKSIGTLPLEQADRDTLISMMVGRQLEEQYPKVTIPLGEIALRVENLSVLDLLHDLSCQVRQGEVLGIFGLMGAGQAEFARHVGLLPISSGQVFIGNQPVHINNQRMR